MPTKLVSNIFIIVTHLFLLPDCAGEIDKIWVLIFAVIVQCLKKKQTKPKQLLNKKALIKVLKGKSDTNISCVS